MQRFMKIRILDPNKKFWHKIRKMRRYYYKVADNEKGSYFVTLDVGDLEEPGIQGLAFIRGFPKNIKTFKVSHRFSKNDWKQYSRTQAIRIEYERINVNEKTSVKRKIKQALKYYRKDIISFLSREYEFEIKDIQIFEKGKDFELTLRIADKRK